MENKISEDGFALSDITKLIITGSLNGTDILCIRNMSNNNSLSDIDLSGANIVAGGSSYNEGKTTANNVIGQYMFSDLINLKTLILPNTVISMEKWCCQKCFKLSSVTIPNSVKYTSGNLFYKCTSLTEVTIPGSIISWGGSNFEGCTSLTTVTYLSGNVKVAFYSFKGCTALTTVNLPDTITEIADSAFSGCISLTSFTVPSGVTTIDKSSFINCSSLSSITMKPVIAPNVSTDNVFTGCNALTKIWTPQEGYFSYMESTGGLATHRSKIDCYITFATPTKLIKPYIYGLLGKAAGATLTASEAATLTSLGTSTFEADTNVGSFEEFRFFTGVTELPRRMFYGSDLSGKLYCPASLTRCGYYGINNCDSLTEVVLSPALTGDYDPTWGTASGYGKQMDNCGILASVTIPEGITTIPESMMQYCYVLNNVVFPSTITKIAANIFRSCTAILSVNGVLTFKSVTPPTLEADMFNSATFRGVIKVPSASVNAYKTATNWSAYASQIVAI